MIGLVAKLFGLRKERPTAPGSGERQVTQPSAQAASASVEATAIGAQGSAMMPPSPCNLAICAIMKDEALNVLEWIAYHRVIGVERFYLYDNGSSDNVRDLLAPLIRQGLVVYKEWLVVPGQMAAYDDFAAHHRLSVRWAAFIDLDEFINVLGDEPLIRWLDKFDNVGGVALQWMMFGPSGFDERPEDLQIASFVHRLPLEAGEHRHVKTIVRMENFKETWDPHAFVTHQSVVDENGMSLSGRYSLQDVLPHSTACIHHYFTRSRRDWIVKLKRGRADTETIEDTRPDNWFDTYSALANVEDLSIFRYVAATRAELARLNATIAAG